MFLELGSVDARIVLETRAASLICVTSGALMTIIKSRKSSLTQCLSKSGPQRKLSVKSLVITCTEILDISSA